MSGIVKVHKIDTGFEIVPRETLQDKRLSLQAIGLLVNVCSYPEDWKLHKTELYKRYEKNKERSVKSAWDELLEAGYVMEKKFRNGRKWEYEYAIRMTPFTEQEKILFMGTKEEKEQKNVQPLRTAFCRPQNEDFKMRTSKRRGNIIHTKENTHQNNTHKDNTHHHPIEGFNELQSELINHFVKENKIDDDTKLKLLEKLKGRDFKYLSYIEKAYETLNNAVQPSKTIRKENMPEYLKDDYKPAEQEKMSVEEIEAIKAKFAEQRKRIRKGSLI